MAVQPSHHSPNSRLIFLVLSIVICTVQRLTVTLVAQQTGFLSIDCGTSRVQAYTDPSTGIVWTPDITIWPDIRNWSTTTAAAIGLPTDMPDQVQYSSFRSFPAVTSSKALNQSKFCYNLPATADNYYLVRASFWYDPAAASAGQIRFRVIVDTYPSVEIVIDLPQKNPWFEEMYVRVQSKGVVSLCLAPSPASQVQSSTSGSTAFVPPFINSLEIRPLPQTMNSVTMIGNTNTAMRTVWRVDSGTSAPGILRYPDDSLDRLWWTGMDLTTPYTVSSLPVAVDTYLSDLPPAAAMTTNYVSSGISGYAFDISSSEILTTTTIQGSHRYYMVLWFAEFNTLINASGQRVFDVKTNDNLFFSVVDVYSSSGLYRAIEIYTKTDKPLGPYTDKFVISSSPASTSSYQPTLAAAEVLQLFDVTMDAVTPTSASDVSAIADLVTSCMVPPSLKSFMGDPCLPLAYKYPWIGCASTSSPAPAATRVTSISLSNYGLVGSIPDSIGTLDQLETLDLSNNGLTGRIPESLSGLSKLKYLNLANNRFTGPIPAALLQKQGLVFIYDPQLLGPDKGKSTNVGLIIGASVGAAALIIIIAGVIIFLCICRMPKTKSSADPLTKQSDQSETQLAGSGGTQYQMIFNSPLPSNQEKVNVNKEEVIKAASVAKEFTYGEILAATSNLSQLLGQGGFGPVYKGTLPTGLEIAVKILADGSKQGAQEFLNEVTLLSRVHHKNLVGFVGYSIEQSLILVYEYMPNGSLHDALFRKNYYRNLSWRERLRILSDAAQGLSYLHHGRNIIHRDIKSSNILLSQNLEGKVSDFGISRLTPDDSKHVDTTRVIGTTGYLDPTYANTFQLTEKADIYSFGVVLLETLCGKPPILRDPKTRTDLHIVEWVRPSFENGTIENIVDERLGDKYNISSIWKVAEIALLCVQLAAVKRPSMISICNDLSEAISMEEGYDSTVLLTTGSESLPYTEVRAR